MVRIWEVILLPPWVQSQSQLSQTGEQPKKTAAVWHNRSEADDGMQSCSWSINLCPWLINNWHLILIWQCAFTLYPSFNSSVMSFQHTWCFGDSYFRSSLLNPSSICFRNAVRRTLYSPLLLCLRFSFLHALVHPDQGVQCCTFEFTVNQRSSLQQAGLGSFKWLKSILWLFCWVGSVGQLPFPSLQSPNQLVCCALVLPLESQTSQEINLTKSSLWFHTLESNMYWSVHQTVCGGVWLFLR